MEKKITIKVKDSIVEILEEAAERNGISVEVLINVILNSWAMQETILKTHRDKTNEP